MTKRRGGNPESAGVSEMGSPLPMELRKRSSPDLYDTPSTSD